MADNVTTGTSVSTLPPSTKIAARSVTYSGDAAQLIAPVGLVVFSGSDDAKTATDVTTAAGLPVRIVQTDVGSIVETDDGSINAGQANVTPVINLPYIFNGATWVRGGLTPYHLRSLATNNATSLKGAAGMVGLITISNINASPRYLKFYNKATAPSPGSDTPVLTFLVPGNTAGAGTNIPIPLCGLSFSTGIAFAIVAGEGDTDNTSVAAGDLHLNIGYL